MSVTLSGVKSAPPVKGRTPTDEQAAAVDAFRTGDPLVLEAGAGTGKTSTLEMMARAQSDLRGVYVAYNRAIADDAKGRFPSTTKCATAHSFAYQAVGKRYRHRLNGPRVKSAEAARILGVRDDLQVAHFRFMPPSQVARLALETVTRFCNSADHEITAAHVPDVIGCERIGDLHAAVVPIARVAWADLLSTGGRLKFTHDVYLKLWALQGPRLEGDYVLLDEAQDANPVIAGVVLAQDAQLIAVGDENQAIYGWRGAVDAMRDWPADTRLALSQSFRFGPAIAEEANRWLSRLRAPLRLTGLPTIPSRVEHCPDARAVLCRSNAGAVAEALYAIQDGRRPAIVGGTQEIRRLAWAAQDLKQACRTEHPDLCVFEDWGQVQEYVEEDESATDLRVLVGLVDSFGTGTMLRVADQAVEEHLADVVVSTAHKAKGREWESVRIAGDFREPEDPQDRRSEAQLAYVAVTRAKLRLDRAELVWNGAKEWR